MQQNAQQPTGQRLTLVSPKASGEEIQGFNHMAPGDKFKVEMNVRDARPADFDGPVLPGGVAELVTGKRMTSWPTLQTDLRNAGATWLDEQVVVDGRLVTSRKPDDIPAFNQAMLQELAGEK
jgi:protease I